MIKLIIRKIREDPINIKKKSFEEAGINRENKKMNIGQKTLNRLTLIGSVVR
jgi:hypothetical protein